MSAYSPRPVTIRDKGNTPWMRKRAAAELEALQSRGVIVNQATPGSEWMMTTRYMPYARYLVITVRD